MADVSVDPECNDPKELFGQGVRAYVLQDYEAAVAALSKASELLVAEHKDDLHASLGEVYLYYGKALLGVSREQSGALGDAVPKNSGEESDDDEEEEQDEGIETEESEENKTEENSASSSVNGDSSKTEKGKAKKPADSQPGFSSDPAPSSSKEDNDDDDEDDEDDAADEQQNGDDGDASDLQLAWEVLELAKAIFQKQDEKKSLAETLVVLGEVGLESENFESAIKDIQQGLDVQKGLFAKDSRAVAETLYKLGMAYSTNSQIDEAIDSFNMSLEYLSNRVKMLEEMKVMSQEHKDEVEDIKSLVPDIEDKIADMRVTKEEATKKVVEAFSGLAPPPAPKISTAASSLSTSSSSSSFQDGAAGGSSKQVTNIMHLVKRKRKLDEEDKSSEEAPAAKKATA